MLERIAKLLAKAEAASTQEEAETYFSKAQELATLHQISLAEAHLVKGKSSSVLTHRDITIGERGKQVNSHLILLFSTIADYNDVKIDIFHGNHRITAYGFSDDIDTVELMWSRIAPIMVRLGEEYLKTDEWRSETEYRAKKVKLDEPYFAWKKRGWGRKLVTHEEVWDNWPITKQAARFSFYQGFRTALSYRLSAQRKATVEQVQKVHDEAGDGISTDVVLAQKKEGVLTHYKQTSTARGSWRGGGSSSYSRSSAAAGRRAGESVSLGGNELGGQRRGLSA